MLLLNDRQAESIMGGVKMPGLSIRSLSLNNALVIAPQLNLALVIGGGKPTITQGNGVDVGAG